MDIEDISTPTKGWRPDRRQLSVFLASKIFYVFISLDSTGAPDGATVSFSETSDGNFLIGTSVNSHKAANIQRDQRVSMVVSDPYTNYTALIKGEAQILSKSQAAPYEELHYTQTPDSKPFKDKPGEVFILIEPYFIKFSDVGVNPWVITEFGKSRIE